MVAVVFYADVWSAYFNIFMQRCFNSTEQCGY